MSKSSVVVLCAYKPGVSWLMDEIAPQLKGKPVASLKIEFKKNEDPTGMRVMYSPARWVHELYPVDEMLAREAGHPAWRRFELSAIRCLAEGAHLSRACLRCRGQGILSREFTVTTVSRPTTA